MTAISLQFGTLHPNMQKAFDTKRDEGIPAKPIALASGAEQNDIQLFIGVLKLLDKETLISIALKTAPQFSPEIAGTLLNVFSQPEIFPEEPAQEIQQIFYNRFIGEDDLQKPTVNFDEEA